MYEFERLSEKDFQDEVPGKSYKLCGLKFLLTPTGSTYYFNIVDTGDLEDTPASKEHGICHYSDFFGPDGMIRSEIDHMLGYETRGYSPEVHTLWEVAQLYNFINQKWYDVNKLCIKGEITEHLIELPYKVESQEDWDRVWPILKKAGFTWSDGEELNEIFSECHDFPELILQVSDLKISIDG